MHRPRLSAWNLARRALFVVAVLGVVVIVLTVIEELSDPLGLSGAGSGHFPNALSWASPDPWRGKTFVGYERSTAETLDRANQGRDINKNLRFVDARTPSTGNLVVSVHPIDHFTWGAAALASNGRCNGVLVAHDPKNPQFGNTHYARFPPGTRCIGLSATAATVLLTDPPD